MEVVPNLQGNTLVIFANKTIEAGSIISSDAYNSYRALAKEDYQHKPKKFDIKEHPDHLHWLHTVVSNVKAYIAGTFHGSDPKHLQAYLNEFCYRFNRRKFKGQLFNRLLSCCVGIQTICYAELTK